MTCEEQGRYLSEIYDTEISGYSFQEMDSYKSERNGKLIIVTPLFCIKCGNISEGWNYIDEVRQRASVRQSKMQALDRG